MKLPKHMQLFLLQAVEQSGTYDPNEALIPIEEYLTGDETNTAIEFLMWCVSTKTRFGHGNIQERFEEFQKAKG